MDKTQSIAALERAIRHPAIGTQSAMARELSVTPQAITFYLSGGRTFPARLAPTIERLTDGEVRCEELCPDVDWAVLRKSAA